MIEAKGDVLVWGPMHPSLMRSLEENYCVHRRWEIADFNHWARLQGDAIRAVVTSGVYGADNATLFIVQHRAIDRARNVIEREFRR